MLFSVYMLAPVSNVGNRRDKNVFYVIVYRIRLRLKLF